MIIPQVRAPQSEPIRNAHGPGVDCLKLSALGTGARLAHVPSPRTPRRLPSAIDCSGRLTGDSENATTEPPLPDLCTERRSAQSARFRCPDFAFATTYPGRIVFAIRQIATTATSRPEALTSRSMSSGSLVRIVAFCRTAVVTTTASTISDVLVMPSNRPASCASVSPSGTTTHPVKKRRSWACCGDRLTWATTAAGTNGTTPSSKRALCSAHARRSFLSAATRTAAS